jgi:hypothetical protein
MRTHYFSCSGRPGAVPPKKHDETCYSKLVFLHPVGSAGHIVHSCASVARNIDEPFFMLVWEQYGFDKNASRHIMLNLCFCILWDLRVT